MQENLAPFFSVAGFGSRVRVDDGREFEGLLDRPSEDRLGMQGREVVLRCAEAALPDPVGRTLSIGGFSYIVRRRHSDGRGVMVLELETV